jgi:hypothetical protein
MAILEMRGGAATASHALGSIGAESIVDGVGDF